MQLQTDMAPLGLVLLLLTLAAGVPAASVVTLWTADFANELGCGWTRPAGQGKVLTQCASNWTVNGDWAFENDTGQFRVMRPSGQTSNWFVSYLVRGRGGITPDTAVFGSKGEIALGRCVRSPQLSFDLQPLGATNLATAMQAVSGPNLAALTALPTAVKQGRNEMAIPAGNQASFFFEFNFPATNGGPSPNLMFQNVQVTAERYAAYDDPQVTVSCTPWQPMDKCVVNQLEARYCVTNTTRRCLNIATGAPETVSRKKKRTRGERWREMEREGGREMERGKGRKKK